MFGLLRLVAIGFPLLTVACISVSLNSRSVQRERLERKCAQIHPFDKTSLARAEFIKRSQRRYDNSVRRLILPVYVIQVIGVGTIIYTVNFM